MTERTPPDNAAPATATMPHPEEWATARGAYDSVKAYNELPADVRRALDALGELLHTYFGNGQEPTAQTCGHCGASIAATVSGTNWVDGEGFDHCPGTSHEPAQEAS